MAEDLASVLLDFAKPLLDRQHPDAPPEDTENRVQAAIAIWNALVLDALGYGNLLEAARVADELPLPKTAIQLSERKKEKYPDDERYVGHYTVRMTDDGIQLHVEEGHMPRAETLMAMSDGEPLN